MSDSKTKYSISEPQPQLVGGEMIMQVMDEEATEIGSLADEIHSQVEQVRRFGCITWW